MAIPARSLAPDRAGDGGPAWLPRPSWAHWNAQPARLYTLGVEDEVMLLDPSDWSLTQCADEVLANLAPDLAPSVRPETGAAVSELRQLRTRLARALADHGLTAAAAGTHPAADWDETEVSRAPRYRVLEDTMRTLVRREPTM